MAIPDYQALMRPVLELLAGRGDYPKADIREAMANRFELSDEELAERLPSGRQTVFSNRVGWAITYLFQTGLLARPSRAVYRITDRGRTVLAEEPGQIDLKVLAQFPELDEFRYERGKRRGSSRSTDLSAISDETSTPVEVMARAHSELRAALATQLMERVMDEPPAFFEQLVLDVLQGMGYGGALDDATDLLGQTGDEGIDGAIREDRLGLDQVYVQAKRWINPIGRPEIQKFVGALTGKGANKGVFITTSTFSREARDYAESISPRVVLVDGDELAQLMIEYKVGVSIEQTFAIEKVDLDYFYGGDDSVSA